MRGGGSKAVWNFSENSSVLETPSFPYRGYRYCIYLISKVKGRVPFIILIP